MNAIEGVERTQAELDQLYGELSAKAGSPNVDELLMILRATDAVIAETRRRALLLEQTRRGVRS